MSGSRPLFAPRLSPADAVHIPRWLAELAAVELKARSVVESSAIDAPGRTFFGSDSRPIRRNDGGQPTMTEAIAELGAFLRRSGGATHAWCGDCGAWPGANARCATCRTIAAEAGLRAKEIDRGQP